VIFLQRIVSDGLVIVPSGLENLEYQEILRHRYLGVSADPPKQHFLGGSDAITFGSAGGEIKKRWDRSLKMLWIGIGKHGERYPWCEAYRIIGNICEHLSLPDHIREEITRIYANLRKQGETTRAGVDLEKQMAKITWLTCMIHRLPRKRSDIERGIREFYEFEIGKIPSEFIKAANTRTRWFWTENKNGRLYLRCQDKFSGEKMLLGRF
jgi:hypothetical protein